MKFLGLVFTPEPTPSLKSKTRNGAELAFNTAAQLLTYLRQEFDKEVKSRLGIETNITVNASKYTPYELLQGLKIEKVESGSTTTAADSKLATWLTTKVAEFKEQSHTERLKLLFSK